MAWRRWTFRLKSDLVGRPAVDVGFPNNSEIEARNNFRRQKVIMSVALVRLGPSSHLTGVRFILRLLFEVRFARRMSVNLQQADMRGAILEIHLINLLFALFDFPNGVQLLHESQFRVSVCALSRFLPLGARDSLLNHFIGG